MNSIKKRFFILLIISISLTVFISCYEKETISGKYLLIKGEYCSDYMIVQKLDKSNYVIKTYMKKSQEVMKEFTGKRHGNKIIGKRGEYNFNISITPNNNVIIIAKSDKYEINGTYRKIEKN